MARGVLAFPRIHLYLEIGHELSHYKLPKSKAMDASQIQTRNLELNFNNDDASRTVIFREANTLLQSIGIGHIINARLLCNMVINSGAI